MPDTTATRIALDHEANRLEHRDRAIALSVAAEKVVAMCDQQASQAMLYSLGFGLRATVQRMMREVAAHAAYEAIQRDRSHHAEDMAMLRSAREGDFARLLNTVPALVIPKEPDDG